MLHYNAGQILQNALMAPLVAEIKILILEDSSFDRRRIKREVEASGLTAEIDEIICLCHLKAMLASNRYDIIICDYFLPDGTGEDALQVILSDGKNCTATPVMISGNPWLNGGSVSALGKTIPLVDKTGLGSGELIKDIVTYRKTSL